MRHSVARTITLAFVLLALTAGQGLPAQTFTVLHNFTGGADGASPAAGLTMDQRGNLYSTAAGGGNEEGACFSGGCGTVFELEHRGTSWTFVPLHVFTGAPDGSHPEARVVFGPDGALYGTTNGGGNTCGGYGCGTVFRLTPPAHACGSVLCHWTETVLYSFSGGSDGEGPANGDLIFDQAGNIYGTTYAGGSYGHGTVFELSHSNGGWTENILYSFQGNNDGAEPVAGVVFDNAGNLYGTTFHGGIYGYGAVSELTHSASGWTEIILHNFNWSDGVSAAGGLILDASGNLYGATYAGGQDHAGTVYELSPTSGGWLFNVLYNFAGNEGSYAKLAMDAAGNLYGTLTFTIPEVFRLTASGGQWTLTGFTGSAGSTPLGNVIFDASDNLYTTANSGGTNGLGVVFEITP